MPALRTRLAQALPRAIVGDFGNFVDSGARRRYSGTALQWSTNEQDC
jgi:hypothetical protein